MAKFKVRIDREITMYQSIDLHIEAASPEEATSKAEAIIADGDDIPWDDLEEESVDDGKPDWGVVKVEPLAADPTTPPDTDMTFEEFTATRKHVENLETVIDSANWEDDPKPPRGFVYLDELYIEEVQDWWPEESKARGKYHLLLGRDDWISDDLTGLERRLYEFAKSEQMTRK